VADVAEVSAILFTDPYCPWCWAAQPQLRRLLAEFGDEVSLTFVLAGPARLPDGPWLAAEALDAAAASGMPLDPRVFLRDPPASAHPAGLAVTAVAEQHAGGRTGAYLRRLQEAILLEGRTMESAPALLDAARATGGLDLERLRRDLGSSAIVEGFAAGLERARTVERLPALDVDGRRVDGRAPYEEWRAAAVAAGAQPGPLPSLEAALRRFGAMATPEVALVCDLPGPRAPAELWRLALEWRVRPRRVLGGELWEAA
jgi:putative protein-disulfide isomerase